MRGLAKIKGMDNWYAPIEELKNLGVEVGPPNKMKGYSTGVFSSVADFLCGKSEMTILDAGCGKAQLRTALQSKGHAYYGIDVESVKADCLADINFLPFGEKRFDLVLCRSVLQYTLTPANALAEFYRVLTEGGRLFCSVSFLEPWSWGSKMHLTPSGITLLATQAGFQVENIWAIWTVDEAVAVSQSGGFQAGNLSSFDEAGKLIYAATLFVIAAKNK